MSVANSCCTYLSVNELHVLRALRVAVASSVLGAGLVVSVFRHTTVGIHLRQVEGTVETAG